MDQHRVLIHTRTLRLTVQAVFSSRALGESWARRISAARQAGHAITIGGVRLGGAEITRVEHGPIGGQLLAVDAAPDDWEPAGARADG